MTQNSQSEFAFVFLMDHKRIFGANFVWMQGVVFPHKQENQYLCLSRPIKRNAWNLLFYWDPKWCATPASKEHSSAWRRTTKARFFFGTFFSHKVSPLNSIPQSLIITILEPHPRTLLAMKPVGVKKWQEKYCIMPCTGSPMLTHSFHVFVSSLS